MISDPLYVWHHINYIWHHNHSLWHHKNLSITSHPHYSWHHTHCIWHYIYSTCDITATVNVTRHLLCFWHYTVYMISHGEWMTTQWLYLTWYPMYLCNQTHMIDDITLYVHMKSHSLHVWHHRYFIWHHIHSCWQHTIVCMSWHTLCLWHHVYYIWCKPYCVYDYTSSISDLKPVKIAVSSTQYVITPSLSKSSHLLCKTSQVACVCHHMCYTWHHIHTLWHQPLLFMTSNALYSLHHTHYIWHLIYSVWCHIHYVCFITQCLSLWHQTLYVYDIFTWYGITQSAVTTQPLCAFTATMPVITLSGFFTLHPMYQLYEKKWMYVITAYICMTPYAIHMTSHPLFMTSHHWSYHITSTARMTSHTQYMT